MAVASAHVTVEMIKLMARAMRDEYYSSDNNTAASLKIVR